MEPDDTAAKGARTSAAPRATVIAGSNVAIATTAWDAGYQGNGNLGDAVPLPVMSTSVRKHPRHEALRMILTAMVGALAGGLVVKLVVGVGDCDERDEGKEQGALATPATCSSVVAYGSLQHLEAYSQYGLPADGIFYAGHAARLVCAEGASLDEPAHADHVLLCRTSMSGAAEWTVVGDATNLFPSCVLTLESESEADDTRPCCMQASSNVYVTANSNCLRGEWNLGGSAAAPTWTGMHGAADEPWIGWRSDLHGGSWQASIGSAYITCDWTLQNEQDYGSDANHGVGCTEGNEAPPEGSPSSCTRWQAQLGHSAVILPADFSVHQCRVC